MKVYFINRNKIDACSYIRSYIPQLLNNFNGCAISISDIKEPDIASKECLESDVIVFYRPSETYEYELAKILKAAGKKIVLDNDDTYKDESPISMIFKGNYQQSHENKIKEFAKLADLITVSTEYLKNEYKKDFPDKEVIVLENCMYKEHFPEEIKKNKTDKIRVGLIGSCVFNADWENAKEVIKQIASDGKHTLVVFGLTRKTKSHCFDKDLDALLEMGNVELHDSVDIVEYYDKLNDLELDYLLVPRADRYFNYCKSNIKVLEAGMLEIPCIVSSFKDNNSPYDKLPNDVCLKCKTLDDWYNAIKILDDKENRIKYGKAARKYVLDNYNIEKRYKEWRDAYNKLFK